MRKDIIITANSKTSRVDLPTSRLGLNGENLQGNIIVKFSDEFVNGNAILEIQRDDEKYYLTMQKENESYYLPILSSLLTNPTTIIMQVRITEGTSITDIPVWKSNKFYLKVEESINAEITIPEEYPEWIDIANAKLNEIDNIDIDVNKVGNTSTVSITKKDGTEKIVEILDGEKGNKGDTGDKGADAKINGVNTLTIEAGTNISLDQEGNILTINSTGGTFSYTDLTNKPKINNVELVGNKSLNDLGIQPVGNYALESEIPDVSNFITKDVNNLTNYTLKTNTGSLIDLEINDTTYVITLKLKNQDGTVISTDTIDLPLESVVVSGRYDNTTKKVILTLENGSEVDFSVADLVAGLQTEITSSNKLASDLVDDTNSGNKFVTTSEKQTWNNKYDKPNSGIPKTDLASTVQTSLNKADTAIQEHQDISGKEDKTNKVTSIDNTSTDTQYPSAKCVHDSQATQDDEIEALQTENERLKATLPTTTGEGQDITLDKTAEMEFIKPPLPRGNTKQDTTTGKNLLQNTATSQTISGVTFTINSDKSITCNGTATANIVFRTAQTPNFPDNEDMLFTGCPVGGSSSTYQLQYSNNRDKAFQDMGNGIVIQKMDYNTYPNTYVQIRIIEGYTCNNLTFYPMIRLATIEDDTYEPYTGGIPSPNPDYSQEIEVVTGNVEVTITNENNAESKTLPVSLGNIELCKIGDYQDYLYKNNGKWYKHKVINKYICTGEENWVYSSYWSKTNTNVFYANVKDDINFPDWNSNTSICNYFITYSRNDMYSLDDNGFCFSGTAGITVASFTVRINKAIATDLAAFKSWLSTHNIILYYELKTAIEEQITDATLISQLEEISKALSYQGQTNITSNTIALFDVEAYQSTKLILENLDSRLTLVEG